MVDSFGPPFDTPTPHGSSQTHQCRVWMANGRWLPTGQRGVTGLSKMGTFSQLYSMLLAHSICSGTPAGKVSKDNVGPRLERQTGCRAASRMKTDWARPAPADAGKMHRLACLWAVAPIASRKLGNLMGCCVLYHCILSCSIFCSLHCCYSSVRNIRKSPSTVSCRSSHHKELIGPAIFKLRGDDHQHLAHCCSRCQLRTLFPSDSMLVLSAVQRPTQSFRCRFWQPT